MSARETLPPGLLLPSGLFLTHEVHRECECAGCAEAWAAYERGELDDQLEEHSTDDEDALPW
jgi:hypothetical protein